MDFEKIKDYCLARKKYLIIGLIFLMGILFLKQTSTDSQSDNTHVLQTNKSKTSTTTQSMTSSIESSTNDSKTVTCDISGAIKKQGVYTLNNGARLDELIKAAGGLKENAQLKAINRAIILKDQDKIHIPYKGEKVPLSENMQANSSADNSGSETGSANNKINLNTASAADLQKLNGVGEKKAQKIVAYRKQNGQFKKVEDLMQVSGIGEKTFAALKDQLAI